MNDIEIDTKGFGAKKISIYEMKNVENLFLACFEHHEQKYTAIMNWQGHILTPFSTWQFEDIFGTNNKENYAFTRYQEDKSCYESYRFQKSKENAFEVKAMVCGDAFTQCRFLSTEKYEFWFLESISHGIREVSLYDVNNAKVIIPFFTEISFEEEESRVLAYVEKDIYAIDEEEIIPLAGLLSFIDWHGNFITPIYIPEQNRQISSLSFNHDKGFRHFNEMVKSLTEILLQEYQEKQQEITDILEQMFQNPYTEAELLPKQPAKILEFRRKADDHD